MEIYLANKKLTEIPDLSRHKCVETLWVNGNKLNKIVGIDEVTTLKCIYAQNNQLSTLKGSLKNLRFLRVLSLYNNRLSDLGATLPHLQHLLQLEQLDLFGNPLANESNYRIRVIRAIPSLHVLDRHEVTDEEREKARKLFSKSKDDDEKVHIAFGERIKPWVPPPSMEITTCAAEMEKEVALIKKKKEEERVAAEATAFTQPIVKNDFVPVVRHRPRGDVFKVMHYEHKLVPSKEDIEEAAAAAVVLPKSTVSSRRTSRITSRRASFSSVSSGQDTTTSLLSKARASFGSNKIQLDMKMQEEYRLRQRLAAKLNRLDPVVVKA